MSVTFSLQIPTANGSEFACKVNHYAVGCDDRAHLEDGFHDDSGICYDCAEWARSICPVCSLAVNVTNSNAALLLERLGVEFDYCGSIDPADLLGRAMVANVGRDDSGVAASEDRGEGGATIIDCGMRPGYFADRFGALADLATAAIERGAVISWG